MPATHIALEICRQCKHSSLRALTVFSQCSKSPSTEGRQQAHAQSLSLWCSVCNTLTITCRTGKVLDRGGTFRSNSPTPRCPPSCRKVNPCIENAMKDSRVWVSYERAAVGTGLLTCGVAVEKLEYSYCEAVQAELSSTIAGTQGHKKCLTKSMPIRAWPSLTVQRRVTCSLLRTMRLDHPRQKVL